MGRAITEKKIKLCICIDDMRSVEDKTVKLSYKVLKQLGAKRRKYKDTKEVFYYIETDYELTL